MRICALILISLLSFTSCKSSKRVHSKTIHSNSSNYTVADKIVDHAMQFDGVRYKYGGTSRKGMDCSGLVLTSFNSENIELPRTTRDLSTSGNWIDLKKVKKGDLLFFATKKNSRRINHVGIVTNTKRNEVEFIHSTSSKGVITSLLSENFWYHAFVQARRIL